MTKTQEKFHEVTRAILEKASDPLDQDAVLSEMFSEGIPFGKLKIIYKSVAIGEGFVPDPVVVKEGIIESLDTVDLEDIKSWEDVEVIIDFVKADVPGCTEVQIIRLLKSYCKDAGLDLPKKKAERKARKRGGNLTRCMVEYARVTPGEDFSRKGLYEAILPTVKGPKNAHYYMSSFLGMLLGVKLGMTLNDAETLIKQMPELSLKSVMEGVQEEA